MSTKKTAKTKIDQVHIAGMDVKIVWDEETLREQQATALWVPARETIFLHPIYRGNNLETMKCLMHEQIHILSRFMNFEIDEATLDSIAQGLAVALAESNILDLDQLVFEE